MKKAIAVVCFLLVPVFIIQSVSLAQFGALREWFASRASSVLRVGVDWPFEANQDGFDKGLLLAQEEINARGLRGRRIELVMRDDRLDREEAREIAMEFARDPRIVATIGYYDDQFAVRASAICEESRLLHLVAGANNNYMTTHGFRYLVRTVLASQYIGRGLARMCMARGYRTYAILAEQGAFGEDLAYQLGAALDALELRVVHLSAYVRGKVDFRETINELKEANADVIFFAGLERESAQFIKLARNMDLDTPIIGSFSDTPEVRAVGAPALEGVMFYELYDVNSPTPENRAFVGKYRKRFGEDPDTYGAQAYDALRLLARAYETTGSADSLDLAYAIRYSGRWEGANGSYKFDSTGELENKDIYLRMYRNGKPVVIATSRAAGDGGPSPAPPLADIPGGAAPGAQGSGALASDPSLAAPDSLAPDAAKPAATPYTLRSQP